MSFLETWERLSKRLESNEIAGYASRKTMREIRVDMETMRLDFDVERNGVAGCQVVIEERDAVIMAMRNEVESLKSSLVARDAQINGLENENSRLIAGVNTKQPDAPPVVVVVEEIPIDPSNG